MTNESLISKIVRNTEAKFGGICYAYQDKDSGYWWIATDDYTTYSSPKFKTWSKNWHKVADRCRVKLVFCYCNPNELALQKLADEDNLIMNV